MRTNLSVAGIENNVSETGFILSSVDSESNIAKARKPHGFFKNLDDITLKRRLSIIFVITMMCWVGVSGFGLMGMSKSEDYITDVVKQRLYAISILNKIEAHYAVDIIDATNKANAGVFTGKEAREHIEKALKSIDSELIELKSLRHSVESTRMIAEAEAMMRAAGITIDRLNNKLNLQPGNVAGQLNDFDGPLYKQLDPIGEKYNDIIALKQKHIEENYALVQQSQINQRNTIISLVFFGAILIGIMLLRTYRIVTVPLAKMASQMQEIAHGNLSLVVSKERNDEIGIASDAFNSMFIKLRLDMADTQRVADEAERMGFALDNVATAVTLSNADNNLFYTNAAARKLLEAIFKSSIAVDRLIGHPIANSLEDEALLSITRGKLDKPRVAEGIVGDFTILLSTSPVLDKKGAYVGRVCQWVDRTSEIAAEKDLQSLMANTQQAANEAQRMAVALDNVAIPVTLSNAENNLFYTNQSARKLLEGIFKSPTAVDRLFGQPIANSLEDPDLLSITRGKLDVPRTAEGRVADRTIRLSTSPVIGSNGEYMGRVCQWMDRTGEIAAEREVQALVEAAAAGNFTRRVDLSDKQGFFKTLAIDLNTLVESSENALEDVVRVLNALAKGDLTQTIERDYQGTFAQMKTDANATVLQLKTIVTTISEATEAINSAAKEIASGNTDLSRRTESQASSLEETASSTEELTKTVRNNADNATRASSLAATSSEVAERGGRVVSEVVQTMGAIAESSSKISEIISVIDGIAFQTNILALNAAVEAARAGEQGRGFAVVAGEVRNLAQRSASAAKEIKGLISESVSKVSIGYKLVETAGQTMQEIVTSTQNVSSIMNEISAASEEQRTGITQLNQAINSMDESTQQNAALVEEAAAAAQSLEDQATNLMQAVSVFRMDNRATGLMAKNVERLPVRAVSTVRSIPTRKSSASSASAKLDDEWEQF